MKSSFPGDLDHSINSECIRNRYNCSTYSLLSFCPINYLKSAEIYMKDAWKGLGTSRTQFLKKSFRESHLFFGRAILLESIILHPAHAYCTIHVICHGHLCDCLYHGGYMTAHNP